MKKDKKTPDSGQQLTLPLMQVDTHITTPEGIEMGVLENGMPYLSQRGISAMAGIARTTFQRLSDNWTERKHTDEAAMAINALVEQNGYTEDELFIEIEQEGKTTYAYTEPVCLALLEYYAFDAKKRSEVAQNSYRTLSKAGFRLFVYQYTGYKPEHHNLDKWKDFHDRVDLNYESVPYGYFSIFKEIAGMIVALIRAEVMVNDKVVPDVSVGLTWGKKWRDESLESEYGERIKYEHNYPDYYRQALSNPQEVWAYPDEALPMFRAWFREEYITRKFPSYMLGQVAKKKIPQLAADGAMKALMPKSLEKKTKELSSHNQNLKKALDYNPKD